MKMDADRGLVAICSCIVVRVLMKGLAAPSIGHEVPQVTGPDVLEGPPVRSSDGDTGVGWVDG